MSMSTPTPTHRHARWTRPSVRVRKPDVAHRRWLPRIHWVRASSCGHILGVAYHWRRLGFIKTRTCR